MPTIQPKYGKCEIKNANGNYAISTREKEKYASKPKVPMRS